MGMMKDIYLKHLEEMHPPPDEPDDTDYEYELSQDHQADAKQEVEQ